MAVVIGTAGGSARRYGWAGRLALPIVAVLMSAVLVALTGWTAGQSGWIRVVGLLTILAEVAYFAWKDRSWYAEMLDDLLASSAWMQGAEGERRVGVHLDSLTDEYVVFHDFHTRDASGELVPWNVDHIVVGPTGVFVVETKMYTATRVRPAATDATTARNVKQVRRNAVELKWRLEKWSSGALSGLFVEAVLVYAQDNAFVERLNEGATQVLPLQYLLKNIIGRRKGDFSQEQAYRVARSLTTMLSDARQREFSSQIRRLDELYAKCRTATGDASEPSPSLALSTDCPECGAPLVRLTAKHGRFRGRPFLGCSRWRLTGCDYKLNLED